MHQSLGLGSKLQTIQLLNVGNEPILKKEKTKSDRRVSLDQALNTTKTRYSSNDSFHFAEESFYGKTEASNRL